MLGAFFQIKAFQASFLPRFHPNLPKFRLTWLKRTKWKHDLQKKRIWVVGAISVKSKHILQFCEGVHTFCPNFHRFCPDFYQIKGFGGAVAPPALPPPTPVRQRIFLSCVMQFWIIVRRFRIHRSATFWMCTTCKFVFFHGLLFMKRTTVDAFKDWRYLSICISQWQVFSNLGWNWIISHRYETC